jgi:hypothetical protein
MGNDPHNSGRQQKQYLELRGEQRANEVQVINTNVKIGQYPGWWPRKMWLLLLP